MVFWLMVYMIIFSLNTCKVADSWIQSGSDFQIFQIMDKERRKKHELKFVQCPLGLSTGLIRTRCKILIKGWFEM